MIVGTCQTVVEPAIIAGIHSTASTQSLALLRVVSEACQSSIAHVVVIVASVALSHE